MDHEPRWRSRCSIPITAGGWGRCSWSTVLREAGYVTTHQHRGGLVKLVCDLHPTEQSVAVMESREHRAEATSLIRLLNPSAVAVIDASREPDTISSRVLSNVRTSGYTGPLYVVNPHATEVQGIRSYPWVTDLPGPVDIAVILVPSNALLEVVRDCAAVHVHGLVIMSATDDDAGHEGPARQRRVANLARMHGMRIIGPSTIGVLNTDPDGRLPIIPQAEQYPDAFREAVTAGFNDANTDAVVVCYVPPLGVVDESIPQALQEISAASLKTTVARMLGPHGVVASEHGRAFPSYPTPEDGVRALVTVANYAMRRREPAGRKLDYSGIDRTGIQDLVEEILSANPGVERVPLNSNDAARLLASYGVAQ